MSIRFLADNDLRYSIVIAVRRREPRVNFESAQEAQLDGVSDPEILDRAAAEERVLISHDHRTMLEHFHARLRMGESSPGLLIVSQDAPLSQVVEAIVNLWGLADPADLRDAVHYLPSLSRHVYRR